MAERRVIETVFTGDASDLEAASKDAQDAVEKAGRSADELGEHFGNSASKTAQLAGGLGDLGGALSQAGGPLGALGTGLEVVGPTIMGFAGFADIAEVATTGWSFANKVLSASLLGIPIFAIVAALVALIAVIYLAWTHSETFRDIVTGAFNTVLGVVQAVWGWISANWPLLLAILTGPIGLAVLAITNNWDAIVNGFDAVIGGIRNGVGEVVGFITGIPGAIMGIVGSVTSAGASVAAGFLSGLNDIVNHVGSSIIGGLSWALNHIIIQPLNSAIGFINDKLIDTANKVPFVNIPKIPNIPELAAGGIATSATLAIFGENVHSRGEAVIPLERLDEMLANRGGGGDIVANLYDADNVLIGTIRGHAADVVSGEVRSLALAGR